MIGFIAFLHSALCICLIVVILMQSGRGGGLTEAFASAESMFGAKTNEMMVRLTAILAVFFLVTSLSLTYLNAKKEQSLMGAADVAETLTLPDIEIPMEPATDATGVVETE
ncbi:MAG: preprotein translocase subunit SecG [Candidatus Omnitrophica bacterium]|nr:preprotein translocase subunit SecG [Candidatus Omnitrophota bacterium]